MGENELKTARKFLGKLVSRIRVERGMSQEELEKFLNLQPNDIAKIEKGTLCLGLDRFIILNEFFDFGLEKVLDDNYEKFSNPLFRLEDFDAIYDKEQLMEVLQSKNINTKKGLIRVRYTGESMSNQSPESLMHDSIITIDIKRNVLNGSIVLAKSKSESGAVIRKYEQSGDDQYLIPLNKSFNTEVLSDGGVILGVATKLERPLHYVARHLK